MFTFYVIQAVTVSRIPLAVALAWILASRGSPAHAPFIGLVFVILIECTDFVDGLMARRTGAVTELGALLDPYSDSVSRILVYWGLASGGLVHPVTPLVMAFRDVTVAYSRILLIRHGHSGSAKLSGKIKAVFQAVGAILAVTGPLYWQYTGFWTVQVISWTVIVVTFASSLEYVLDGAIAVRKANLLRLADQSDAVEKTAG